MVKQCILCQKNPPIQNSHIMPKFIVKYLKAQASVNYLKHSWDFNQKLQDGFKGNYLCATCDNVIVSNWENYFKRNWFDPFVGTQKDKLLITEEILSFLLSLLLRYSEHFLQINPGRNDSHLPKTLQNLTRDLITFKQYHKIGSEFYIYSAFIHPIIDNNNFLPGINQLLFNSYNGILLPHEGYLPTITLIWIPSFLFIFSEKSLESINEIKVLNIFNSLKLNMTLQTSSQNLGLLYLVNGILNRHTSNMNISQIKQIKKDFDKLKESFQKDPIPDSRMSNKARKWDKALKYYQCKHNKIKNLI